VGTDADAFRVLFDDNPRPTFVSDRETLRIVTVNRAACELYGWSHDEFLGMNLRDMRPSEDVAYFEEAYADVSKAHERTYARRARHRTKAGRVLDVSLEITSTTFAGRLAALAVITNMTGIRDAERRFKLLVEHSADGISLTNADHVVEYVSPGGMRILGYADTDIVGERAGILAHPDDLARWRAPACGETNIHVARMRHRDGTWRWIESSTTNLTHDPAVRAYVTNYRDITERKLAEESVRKSETNFRTLIECAPIATFVHNNGRYVYVNPAAVVLLGHRHANEIIDRPVLDYVHPDAREALARRMDELRAVGTAAFTGLRLLRADGSDVVLEGEAMLLDYDGVPSHVVMGHDVTERDALFARMAMADRMLSMGTLAAGVAHEINNPLAYITTNLELLAAELPNIRPSRGSRLNDAALSSLVSDARDGVARVNAIVRDLRTLSRPDEQKPGPLDVADILASSIKMTNNEIRHRARVAQSFAEDLPPVDADASRLGQVFVNLLLNAAQAIGDGQADRNEIRVRARSTDGGRRVRVEIEDTGVGIPASIIGRIFDPFFTTKAPGAGMGLGLAISHQIVHSIGGEISVESQPGVGSTFSVLLPAAAAHARDGAGEPAPPERLSRRILLVDDEPAVGRSLQMMLAPESDVVAVVRAADALELLARGEKFDAIVCDLMMPQSSGIQLYEQIARVAPEHLGRMIFMTGGAFTTQAREFLAGLGRPYLQKPFSVQQLRDALASVTR
jgi:PAS domain S-box-containing protein